MSTLSIQLTKALASAVVTAAALGGCAMMCGAKKCGAGASAQACGACKGKCGACKGKCGACGAKK